MSESDTMFNKRDRRCAAVQPMLSTDLSYDRTIASTLKMQIWIATNYKDVPSVMKTKFPATVFVWFQVRATSCHLTSSKSAWKSTPKCTWICWKVWWSPGAIRWPVADPGRGSRTRRQPTSRKRPRLGFRRSATTLHPSLTDPSPPPTWTCWTASFGHKSRTSPAWPSKTPKPAWSPPSAAYSPSTRRRLWKRHAPSSGSVSRRWLRLKVATLNRCQLYYIIKLPELSFYVLDMYIYKCCHRNECRNFQIQYIKQCLTKSTILIHLIFIISLCNEKQKQNWQIKSNNLANGITF